MNRQFVLRRFDIEKDISSFHRLHSDAESMLYYGMQEFKSIDESYKLMMAYINSENNHKSIHRVICDSLNNEYIGEIGLFNIHMEHHRANAYCVLLPEHRKKGVSIKASGIFYKEVFDQLHINRVQALVDSRNINAIKSLLGIGFTHEGTLHQYEFDNNEFIDMEIFSLIKTRYYELYR